MGFSFLLYAQTSKDLSAVLPKEIDGWIKLNDDREFNSENLYGYIDGAAELYLSFGFSKVFNRIYNKGNDEIFLDIFYMNTPVDAYGVFTFSSGEVGNHYGQQSQVTSESILFWKNNYYISLTCTRATEQSQKAIAHLAKLLDDSINEIGELPQIITYLPTVNLNRESPRYFRHYIWLNSLSFISNENLLNINQSTECLLANYTGEDKSTILLIKYSNRLEAETAQKKFLSKINFKLGNKNIGRLNSGKWIGYKLINNFFVYVFDALSKPVINKQLNSIENLINYK